MIGPLEKTFIDNDGKECRFVLHKLPATVCRQIIMVYTPSAIPKFGDYAVNVENMHLLMGYVGVRLPDGNLLMLTSEALINNHVPDGETLMKIELAMLEYNVSFFKAEKASSFLESMVEKAKLWAMQTLMDFSAQSSKKSKRPSRS